MGNTFGNNLKITIFGESHGETIGCVLDGYPAGIKVDEEYINKKMNLRKAQGTISTSRNEKDNFKIVSGVFNGYSSGSPITILINNEDVKSHDYSSIKNTPRPSHADYSANCKYYGFQDYRGGGHFSGRLTAPIVAAGAMCEYALLTKGIKLGSHITNIGGIKDTKYSEDINELDKQIEFLENEYIAVLNSDKKEEMIKTIEEARKNEDAVGGVIEVAINHVPAGLGDPTFDSLESSLAHAMFSVGAVKGISFGLGFDFVNKKSSEVNDEFEMNNGKVITKTNNNGGINGGISNGMPITFECIIKPTPSISKKQQTIDMESNENTTIAIKGRHDPCIVHRARIVLECMSAIVMLDAYLTRYGQNFIGNKDA